MLYFQYLKKKEKNKLKQSVKSKNDHKNGQTIFA